jgi:hypothetical protein
MPVRNDVYRLAGRQNADTRTELFTALMGCRVAKAHAGIDRLEKLLFGVFGVNQVQCMARQRDELAVKIQQVATDGGHLTLNCEDCGAEFMTGETYDLNRPNAHKCNSCTERPRRAQRLTTPHAGKFLGGACELCGLPPESPLHTYVLPGFEAALGLESDAAATQQAEELSARMRQPIKDVSQMAGRIERITGLSRETAQQLAERIHFSN